MLRLRYIFTIVFGILVAGSAVIGAQLLLQPVGQENAAYLPAPDMATVYVAAEEIPFGSTLTEELIRAVAWPQADVPRLAITDKGYLFPTGEGARRTKGHFAEGEMFIATKLSAYGEEVSSVPRSDPQRRAMAIRVREEALSGGLVGPGDIVDVFFAEGDGRDVRMVTLLHGARVLALGQGGLVALEVTQTEGQQLALAQETGALILALHLGDGQGVAEPSPIELRGLLGEAAPTAEAAQQGPSVVVRRAGTATTETVPSLGE